MGNVYWRATIQLMPFDKTLCFPQVPVCHNSPFLSQPGSNRSFRYFGILEPQRITRGVGRFTEMQRGINKRFLLQGLPCMNKNLVTSFNLNVRLKKKKATRASALHSKLVFIFAQLCLRSNLMLSLKRQSPGTEGGIMIHQVFFSRQKNNHRGRVIWCGKKVPL